MTFTSNGIQTFNVQAGQRYALAVAGSASSFGTMRVYWLDSSGGAVPFESAALTATGGFSFTAPTPAILVELSGATAPNLRVLISPSNARLPMESQVATNNNTPAEPVYGTRIALQVMAKTTPVVFGNQTSMTVTLKAMPVSGDPGGTLNRFMLIEFSTNLATWLALPGPEQGPGGYSQAWSTGPTGLFNVTVSAIGDQVAAWKNMFFRGRYRLG